MDFKIKKTPVPFDREEDKEIRQQGYCNERNRKRNINDRSSREKKIKKYYNEDIVMKKLEKGT